MVIISVWLRKIFSLKLIIVIDSLMPFEAPPYGENSQRLLCVFFFNQDGFYVPLKKKLNRSFHQTMPIQKYFQFKLFVFTNSYTKCISFSVTSISSQNMSWCFQCLFKHIINSNYLYIYNLVYEMYASHSRIHHHTIIHWLLQVLNLHFSYLVHNFKSNINIS